MLCEGGAGSALRSGGPVPPPLPPGLRLAQPSRHARPRSDRFIGAGGWGSRCPGLWGRGGASSAGAAQLWGMGLPQKVSIKSHRMRGLRRRCSSRPPRRLSQRVPGCVQSRTFTGRGVWAPASQTTLPSTPPAPGRVLSKRCNASWRCHCHQPGGVQGGEGADLRKSLRVLSRR